MPLINVETKEENSVQILSFLPKLEPDLLTVSGAGSTSVVAKERNKVWCRYLGELQVGGEGHLEAGHEEAGPLRDVAQQQVHRHRKLGHVLLKSWDTQESHISDPISARQIHQLSGGGRCINYYYRWTSIAISSSS